MKDHIVVDLDGTLFDIGHRVDYAKAGQWEDFHSRCHMDKPHLDVLNMLAAIAPRVQGVVVVTGRNERYRSKTLAQLNKHSVLVDDLLMRPDDDYQPDAAIKLALLESLFGDKQAVIDAVAFCLEDRDKVVEAFRNYGLPTWQVRAGEY